MGKIKSYSFVRAGRDDLYIKVGAVCVCVVNEMLWHLKGVISHEIFQLSGREFDRFKLFLVENRDVVDAFSALISTWTCSGKEGVQPEHLRLEYRNLLMSRSDILTPEERSKIQDYGEKLTRQVAVRPQPRPTYIYLMRDGHSGYTKIGKSINPTVREKTLQSEKPDTVSLKAWKSTEDKERWLHDLYSEHRVRGEWFELSDHDIEYIAELFAGAEEYACN